jgi:hypothetical protein
MATVERHGVVVTYACTGQDPRSHESVTRDGVARRLASLLKLDFAGEYDPAARLGGRAYFVPSDTIVGCTLAGRLGIRDAQDLFGAVVPHAFVATKSITHPLADGQAHVPHGWSHAFADAVRPWVLDGFAAFDRDDASRGAKALLARGEVRVKRALGIGGGGQFVVRDADELDGVLAGLDQDELLQCGVVVEQNLRSVRTYSVGRVHVGDTVATYCGTQCLTRNNHGAEVYGGSDLMFARGDFEALLALDLDQGQRLAIAHARAYDEAAHAHFDGFAASRRNYDVAEGLDTYGTRRTGVLEQSWRIGGASGAEVAALEAFAADPALFVLRARCVELYGEGHVAPAEATIYYRDIDARVGMLTKYTLVERHADAR